MASKEILKSYYLPILAGLSTLSLIGITFQLSKISSTLNTISISTIPINKWAKTQNECIIKTFRIDGKNTQGLPAKVWSCNGGGN